jgi:hypothetical protein
VPIRAVLLLSAIPLWAAGQPTLRVEPQPGGTLAVSISAAGREILRSPAEGLWSIACDWRNTWPADWAHASPSTQTETGGWTILRGEFSACGGRWTVEDAYRPHAGVIEARRRFTWQGPSAAPRVTLSVRFQAPAQKAQALLPGILYYGNPSGARSGRVPVWQGYPGEEAIFEEHRFPMPFAYLELTTPAGLAGAALHSVPSPVRGGNLTDQWWSMGVIGREARAELTLLSGPCAANGHRGVIKAFQKTFVPYDNAWLRLDPGAVVEKEFYLDVFSVDREGSGFTRPVRTALALAGGFDASAEPSIAEIVRAKWRYARPRWHEGEGQAGFRKYVDRRQIVMGWTGQAEALGYALQVLSPGLHDPDIPHMVKASLDFLCGAEFYPRGFHNWYDIDKRTWYGDELLNQGQAMLAFARAIRWGRTHGVDTRRWEAFLQKAADLHSARIQGPDWHPPSTSDAAFIAPLVMASQLLARPKYQQAAVKAAAHYADRHLSMREPYWGGTLDAQCEDKEGAAMAFQAFLSLYEATHEPKYLEWARHAADVVLTYVVTWNIDLPPGRLRDHAFRTKGWTAVSPQNQHLDVWGTYVAPDLYKLGQIDGREDLRQLALLMYRSCGQLIDPQGSQGEQMQQTNYIQGTQAAAGKTLRGGYNETWTVFWITAHFLTGAAQFAEQGVKIW